MKDEDKSKEQLIKGIKVLQTQVAGLEKSEFRLRETEDRLSAIISKSPIPTALGGAGGSIIVFNEALERLIGYKSSEIHDVEDWANKLYPDKEYRDFVNKNIKQALDGQKQNCTEFTIVCKDKSIKMVDFYTSFFQGGLVIQMIDITERKKAEEEKEKLQQQIIQSEKMAALGEIAAGIAHELNTPLNVILGYQELMKKKIEKCPEFKEYVNISLEEVEQCRRLIVDFLLYARPAGEGILKERSVAITEMINNVVRLMSIHKEKNINIILDMDENIPLISGDKKQIMQVFMNVLNNSIQAMPEGGDVTISARHIKNGGIAKNGEIIEFRITDTGEGIPRENITKVFDPFFTSKRPGRGTGLGLAVCQRIMENHKGTIRIESEPGKGTTVIGQLPV